MLWLDETNAEDYLRSQGRIEPDERVRIEALPGGVSNQVLYVKFLTPARPDFVLKQARPQLRTPQPWFSSIERIWREVEVLKVCQEVLQRTTTEIRTTEAAGRQIVTPQIIFEDRDNYAFAMTAAPRDHVVWKARLLAGDADPTIAAQCGRLLGTLHGHTWQDPDVERRLGDRQLFDELRIDPYYRTVAALDAEAGELMGRLISSVESHACALVHADFSPKNLLVYSDGLMMVDFETGHYGDPAFDLGFFLSHLALKAVYHAPHHEPFLALTQQFWQSYTGVMAGTPQYEDLVARGIQTFAGCAWARIDGKSKVEYLLDSPRRDSVRQLCREMLLLKESLRSWSEVLDRLRRMLG